MLNLLYAFCSVVTMPVEMALRLRYGSRYFNPLIMMACFLMMIFLPIFFTLGGAALRMVPLLRFHASYGMLGMTGLSKLFFLGSFIHGIRIWRRMLHMEREENSLYEGPPLPFFQLLPGASFWRVRIVYEPAFLFVLSIVLQNFFILEPGAAHFLTISAFLLAMKQYCAWYAQWQFLRELLDMRHAGPIIAKLMENQATENDLAKLHMASLPKELPEDVRRSVIARIARIFSQEK
jgi:hypothetical protein